jgi:mono/diheme cytochrome c family protein
MPKELRSEIEKSLRPITEPVDMPDLSDSLQRGKYLVRLGECAGCHTSHAEYNPGLLGGGNYIDRFGHKVYSANITVDESGIGYGPAGFMFVIRTGKGGTLSPTMPWIAFKNMNDDDLKAIYAYLRTFPPVKHLVSNQLPFTRCAICGMDHGLGDKNKRERPAGIKIDPALYGLYAGTYFNERYNFSVTVTREKSNLIFQPWENGPKIELVPQSESHFLAPGWFLPMSFIKDEKGQIAQMREDSDEGLVYKKVK